MPWTVDDVDDFISGLTDTEKRKWVKLANSVYEDCMEEHNDDELCAPRAIRIANADYDQVELEENMKTEKKMLAQVQAQPVPEDIRPDVHNGRDHLVIPVVALKEAVVKGQLLPGDQIQNSRQLWTDTPTPVHHPKGTSAREQQVVDRSSLGRFYNVRFEDNKLKGEIWVDEQKAIQARKQNDDRRAMQLWETYRRLKAGEAMDVSTSYWHDTIDESGTYEGTPYQGVQVNLRPDHLAILPDQRGELSLPDGVGVPLKNIWSGADVNMDKTDLQEIRETPRDPTYNETTESSWSRRTLQQFGEERGWDMDEIDSVADLTGNQKNVAANSSILGSEEATTWQGLTYFQCVDGNGVLYKGALSTIRGGRGAQADIPDDVYERAEQKAKDLLQSAFGVEYSENSQGLVQRILSVFRGETMEKQELVEELLDRGVGIPEGDLLDMTQENLEAMEEATQKPEPEPEEEEEEEPPEPEKEESVTEKTDNIDELIEQKVQERMEAQKKTDLVNKLDNSKRVDFDREELEAMPLSALRKVENSSIPGNYEGAGGSFQQNSGPEDKEFIPAKPILTATEGE